MFHSLHNDDETETDSDHSFIVEENHINDFYQTSSPPSLDYSILTQSELRKLQNEQITTVSSVLSLTEAAAILLLCHHNWNVSKVNDVWFFDEAKVRKLIGLFENPVVVKTLNSDSRNLMLCGICLENCEVYDMCAVSCNHLFCRDCWKSYISNSINDGGSSCLFLKCPHPACGAAVDRDMIDEFGMNEEREKFGSYLLRSFVEESKRMKWCPSPGCEFVVKFCGGGDFDVVCLCDNRFCWNCCWEIHRPVDCDTVEKWGMKNKSEAENTKWILAHTKPCPKCKKPIEKNQGCNVMTCRSPCLFQFCWLCLHGISDHRSASCNGFVANSGEESEVEDKRENARIHLRKYTHYFERCENNRKSRHKAIKDLELVKTDKMERLNQIQDHPISELRFLSEAWLQIIESRRVLQWSYAYGYYLPEEEKGKKQLFEYLQGQAELILERLHHCAEDEVLKFLSMRKPSESFIGFRMKLIGLTKVAETHFRNLVRALENGLEEVETGEGWNTEMDTETETETETEADWLCGFCASANQGSSMNCYICRQLREDSSSRRSYGGFMI